MPFYERRIYSGDLLEVERYFATATGKKVPRDTGDGETSESQADLNNRNAQKKLIRLINTNFSGKRGDLFVTLTYSKPVDEKTARQEVRRYLDRVRYHRKTNNLEEFKYIVITEKQSKWHHHIIMNSLPVEVIKDLWNRGRVTISVLDNTYNYEDLARYLVQTEKQPKNDPQGDNVKPTRRKYSRRWSGSLNLEKPTVVIEKIKRPSVRVQPKAPEGYRLLPNWNTGCDVQGNIYQFYKCVKLKKSTRGLKKPINRRTMA